MVGDANCMRARRRSPPVPWFCSQLQEACMGGELFDMVIERKHFTEVRRSAMCIASWESERLG